MAGPRSVHVYLRRGRSVVDYCLVPEEELMSIRNFDVKTMSQCEDELCGVKKGIGYLTTPFFYRTYWKMGGAWSTSYYY